MNPAALYPWIKAAHVAAALLFAAGLLATTLFLCVTRDGDPGRQQMAQALRRWDRAVTAPALLALWVFGFTLASLGHWLGQPWLNAKFVLVVLLSGLHGIQSGKLRRTGTGVDAGALPARPTLVALFVCICGVAILAVVKPH